MPQLSFSLSPLSSARSVVPSYLFLYFACWFVEYVSVVYSVENLQMPRKDNGQDARRTRVVRRDTPAPGSPSLDGISAMVYFTWLWSILSSILSCVVWGLWRDCCSDFPGYRFQHSSIKIIIIITIMNRPFYSNMFQWLSVSGLLKKKKAINFWQECFF